MNALSLSTLGTRGLKHCLRNLTILLNIAALLICTAGQVSAQTKVTYFHNDLSGNPVAASNSTGQIIWRESYRPYGERLKNEAASQTNSQWYTGHRQDVDTGLVYMGARHYDPLMGRFLSIDPAGFDEGNPHSFNRYAYANNNPLKFIDPDGRNPYAIAVIARIAFGGAAAVSVGSMTLSPEAQARIRQDVSDGFRSGADALGGFITTLMEGGKTPTVQDITVPADKYPESAGHIQDAQNSGQPDVLTIDRGGAKQRRKDALGNVAPVAGSDRDEYPPAMFGEGGAGASVRPIAPSDNRGAGACIGAQCRGMPDGTRVRVKVE